jgi:hypothetical protein
MNKHFFVKEKTRKTLQMGHLFANGLIAEHVVNLKEIVATENLKFWSRFGLLKLTLARPRLQCRA